jgi:hypothetical protein
MGLGLFLIAIAGKSDDLKRATLAVFTLIALMSMPAYMSGKAAENVLRDDPELSQALMTAHDGAGLLAFLAIEITGGLAWLALWQFRRRSHPARWTLQAVLAGSIVTVGLMTIAGNTGGAIRHPEILTGEQATSVLATMGIGLDAWLRYLVTGTSNWVWPTLEAIHFLGLVLLMSAVGILNMRMLGFLKQVPVRPLHQFIPWGMAGLAINTVTGMLFFLGMPFFYVYNVDFQFKIFAVVLAGAILLLHTAGVHDGEELGPGEDASPVAKILAGSSILLWVAVVVAGRYMPLFEDIR